MNIIRSILAIVLVLLIIVLFALVVIMLVDSYGLKTNIELYGIVDGFWASVKSVLSFDVATLG